MKPTQAIAHSGHSHQRNPPSPSPTSEVLPANQNDEIEKQSIPRENETLSSPASAIEANVAEGNIIEVGSTSSFIPLVGEGIFFLLLLAPIVLIWSKQQYYRSHRKI